MAAIARPSTRVIHLVMHVIVIGAGIIGATAAHALLDERYEVTIIDREGPAAGTSQGNAGFIAHSEAVPLASPDTLRRVPGYLADPLGPLALRPAYVPLMLPWFLRFLWASRPAAFERSRVALTTLQRRAMPAWERLAGDLGLGPMIHKRGSLYIYDEEGTFEAVKSRLPARRAEGFEVDAVDPHELRQLEPNLREGLAGAVFHSTGAHVADPRAITRAVFDAAIARGAQFVRGQAVALSPAHTGGIVVLEGGRSLEAGAVVLAAGVWSKKLAATLGDRVALETERGYNVSFPGVTGIVNRPVSLVGHGFIFSPLESGLRIGGAVEFAGLDAPPNHARTRALYAKATTFIRELPAYESGNEWMGHRPSTPDSLPVIGPSRASPWIIHAYGHGHLGLTQSALTAGLVADLIAGRPPPIDLAPFSPQRF